MLDSYALLACLRQETGVARIAEMLGRARPSVNYSETLAKFGGGVNLVRRVLDEWGVTRIPFTVEQATVAASLYEPVHGLVTVAWADTGIGGLTVHLIR